MRKIQDRRITRANKKKCQEQHLDGKNAFGINDPTPMAAVQNIKREENHGRLS